MYVVRVHSDSIDRYIMLRACGANILLETLGRATLQGRAGHSVRQDGTLKKTPEGKVPTSHSSQLLCILAHWSSRKAYLAVQRKAVESLVVGQSGCLMGGGMGGGGRG